VFQPYIASNQQFRGKNIDRKKRNTFCLCYTKETLEGNMD